MDIKICKQCGHETVENSSFSMFKKKSCPNCGGNDFIISPAPSNYGKEDKISTTPPNYGNENRSPARNKLNVGFKVLILIFALIGMIFISMFLYYFFYYFFQALGLF